MARKWLRAGDLAVGMVCSSLALCFFVPVLSLKGSFNWYTFSLGTAIFLGLNHLLLILWASFSACRTWIRLTVFGSILAAEYGLMELGAYLFEVEEFTKNDKLLFDLSEFTRLFCLLFVVTIITLSLFSARSKVNFLSPEQTFRHTNWVAWLVSFAGMLLIALYLLRRGTALSDDVLMATSILVGQTVVATILLLGVPTLAFAHIATGRSQLIASIALVFVIFGLLLVAGIYENMFGRSSEPPRILSLMTVCVVLVPIYIGFAVLANLDGYRLARSTTKTTGSTSPSPVIEAKPVHVAAFTLVSGLAICGFVVYLAALYFVCHTYDLRTVYYSKLANGRLMYKLKQCGAVEDGGGFVMAGNFEKAESIGKYLRNADSLSYWTFQSSNGSDPTVRPEELSGVTNANNVFEVRLIGITFDESFRSKACSLGDKEVKLILRNTQNTDLLFKAIAGCRNVKSIELEETDLTYEGAQSLAKLQRVQELSVYRSKLDAATFAPLADIEADVILLASDRQSGFSFNSSSVELIQTINTDVFLEELVRTDAKESLVLRKTDMSDEMAGRLGLMMSLRNLRIEGGTIGADSLAGLSRNGQFRTIAINDLPITDRFVIHEITRLENLRQLELTSTNITTACIKPLLNARRNSTLWLKIQNTKVSPFGFFQFIQNESTYLWGPHEWNSVTIDSDFDWIAALLNEFDEKMEIVLPIISSKIEKDSSGKIVGAALRPEIALYDVNLKHFLQIDTLRWLDFGETRYQRDKSTDENRNNEGVALAELKALKDMERLIIPRKSLARDPADTMMFVSGQTTEYKIEVVSADELFSAMTELTQLREIEMNPGNLSDAVVRKLSLMQNLEKIHISPLGISSTLIDQLQSLKKLKEIVIDPSAANVKSADVADEVALLSQSLPDVEITVVADKEIDE